jgi:hypothetical protein
MKNIFFLIILLLVLLLGLPLLGILATGQDVTQYSEFPPLTHYVSHASFSWFFFLSLVMLTLLVLGLLLYQLLHKQFSADPKLHQHTKAFPWWGIMGLLLLVISWGVAWSRFPFLSIIQPYTFFPLWIGYILSVNGLTYIRSGSCLLISRPTYFFLLFPMSACFWWFFEYLNRFVQNWYYIGIEDFSVPEYLFHASLCFSTVLPAVLSTEAFLSTYLRLSEPLKTSFAIQCRRPRLIAMSVFLVSAIGLLTIGIWPDYMFPLLWLSPLIIIVTVKKMMGQSTIFDRIGEGDWRVIWLPALSALLCGFFWELWNVKSYAHWAYSIPFVQKFHIFKMPILGYLGYLPFGLECKAVSSLIEEFLNEIARGEGAS